MKKPVLFICIIILAAGCKQLKRQIEKFMFDFSKAV